MASDEPKKFDLEEVFDKPNRIFKNEQVFDPTYIPEEIVHCEGKLVTLAKYVQSIIYRDNSCSGKCVVAHGPTGSGKTLVVNYFGYQLHKYCIEHAKNDPKIVPLLFLHINCRRNHSWHLILTSILRGLVPAFPVRGFSGAELLTQLTTILNENGMRLLLCLDEVDYFLSKPEDYDILYALIRQDENDFGPRMQTARIFPRFQRLQPQISLILITRDPNFLAQCDGSIRSSMGSKTMVFEPYSPLQLQDILKRRAEEGLYSEILSRERLRSIAAGINGDARRAIELLW